jgi:hypothetical protein
MNERSDDALNMKEMATSLSSAVAASVAEDRKINYAAKTGNMVFPSAAVSSVASAHTSRTSSPISSARNSSHKKYVQVTFDFEAEGPGELTSRSYI